MCRIMFVQTLNKTGQMSKSAKARNDGRVWRLNRLDHFLGQHSCVRVSTSHSWQSWNHPWQSCYHSRQSWYNSWQSCYNSWESCYHSCQSRQSWHRYLQSCHHCWQSLYHSWQSTFFIFVLDHELLFLQDYFLCRIFWISGFLMLRTFSFGLFFSSGLFGPENFRISRNGGIVKFKLPLRGRPSSDPHPPPLIKNENFA